MGETVRVNMVAKLVVASACQAFLERCREAFASDVFPELAVIEARSVRQLLLAIAPLGPQFDVYARIGVEQSEIKVNASTNVTPGNANLADKQTGATYGVGGHWYFTKNVGVFAEWMKNDKIRVDSYLFGVDFRF